LKVPFIAVLSGKKGTFSLPLNFNFCHNISLVPPQRKRIHHALLEKRPLRMEAYTLIEESSFVVPFPSFSS
jgi:hypothetical protein